MLIASPRQYIDSITPIRGAAKEGHPIYETEQNTSTAGLFLVAAYPLTFWVATLEHFCFRIW